MGHLKNKTIRKFNEKDLRDKLNIETESEQIKIEAEKMKTLVTLEDEEEDLK